MIALDTNPQNKKALIVNKFFAIHVMVMYIVGGYFETYESMYNASKVFPPPENSFRNAAIRSRAFAVVKYDRYYDVLMKTENIENVFVS